MQVPRESLERELRRWASRLARLAFLMWATVAAQAFAQSSGSVIGQLTDLYSKPLSGATVILRNVETGAESKTISTRKGAYRFNGLPPGDYLLEAVTAQQRHGAVDGIVISADHETRIQTALAIEGQSESEVVAETESSPTREEQSLSSDVVPPSQSAITDSAMPPSRSSSPVGPGTEAASAEAQITTTPSGSGIAAEGTRAGITASATRISSANLAPDSAPPATDIAIGGAAEISNSTATQFTAVRSALLALASLSSAQAKFALSLHLPAVPALAVGPQPEFATTLSSDVLQNLPLAGRHWENFLPGAQSAQSSPDENSLSGATAALPGAVTIDGANTRLAFGGRGIHHGETSSLLSANSSEAAVGEIRIADSEEWTASSAAGERTELSTRRGENSLHGQAFLFTRQNLFNARNPFTQWVKETSPATSTTTPVFTPFAYTPPDRQVRWGLGVGSDLRRNRLFWFTAVDAEQRNDPGVATLKHPDLFFARPSNDEMQLLSARLALSGADPVGEGIAAYSEMLESLDGLLGPAPRTAQQWTGFGRVDWRAAERHRLALEGTGADWDSPGGGLTRASEAYGKTSFGASRASEQWALARWEAFLTSNLLLTTQGSAGRQIQQMPPETPSAFEQPFAANLWRRLPQMTFDSRYGFTIGNPARFGPGSYPDEHLSQWRESLDWVHGPVLIKAGLDLRHSDDATSLLRNQTGTYHYARVENFASDALGFAKYGLTDALDPLDQHNCDPSGKAWRDPQGELRGLGYLPCYSYYTQTLGPSQWHLSASDWAAFATAQWEPAKRLVLSAGLRWDREELPPPIAFLDNPNLPLTQTLPRLGNAWEPRLGLAWGIPESRWPVLQLGYGMYAGRTTNSIIETALTQTGSLKGDLAYLIRPTDNLSSEEGGAPPFPYVLAGQPGSVEKPGAVEFAPGFRNPQIHQGQVALEEMLPGHIVLHAGAVVSLARHLPVSEDTNFDPAVNPGTITYSVLDPGGRGPIKSAQITVPFFASWPAANGANGRLHPDYQQIAELMSRANSTYEAAVVHVVRTARRGLSFHVRYTYSHATDWNPFEGLRAAGTSVLDPTNFKLEYGASDLDMRHSASGFLLWEAPWKRSGAEGILVNGWRLSAIGQYHSGLPYTMRTTGAIPALFQTTGAVIAGLGPGMNGYGGDNRVYGVGRNTYRYPSEWKADLRIGRRFVLPYRRELELMAESFNLFNHQNVTELETTGYYIEPASTSRLFPTLNFLSGLKPGQTEFGQPLNINATDFYRERQFDFGLRFRF